MKARTHGQDEGDDDAQGGSELGLAPDHHRSEQRCEESGDLGGDPLFVPADHFAHITDDDQQRQGDIADDEEPDALRFRRVGGGRAQEGHQGESADPGELPLAAPLLDKLTLQADQRAHQERGSEAPPGFEVEPGVHTRSE